MVVFPVFTHLNFFELKFRTNFRVRSPGVDVDVHCGHRGRVCVWQEREEEEAGVLPFFVRLRSRQAMGRDTSPDTYSIVSTFSFYLTLSLLSIVGSLYLLRKFASPVLDGRYVTFPCTWVLRSFSSLSCRVVSCCASTHGYVGVCCWQVFGLADVVLGAGAGAD